MDKISSAFKEHYTGCILKYGPNAAGIDWGKQEVADVTYSKMVNVIQNTSEKSSAQILDVGCGYGGLLSYAITNNIELEYTGIDIVPEMIENGKLLHPDANFLTGDFLSAENLDQYDYVICNGILTLKLAASILDMNEYAAALIRKLFRTAKLGIAFNMMTNRVNYQVDNLYYRSPVEILAFCLSELSNKVRIDHSYPRYEFTTYVYKD